MPSVLLLRDPLTGPHPLQQDLEAAGFEVLAAVDSCSLLVQAAVQHAPDVVVGAVNATDPALFPTTQALSDVSPCPLLLFTPQASAEHSAKAVESGVHAWVVNGYGAARLRSLVQLAQARFARERALADQLRDVTQRLDERKVIERAKGILMRAREVSDDVAFEILRTASMHANQRLGQVSQHIVQSAHFAEALNRAGQLRMLSQRLVKLHLLRLRGGKTRPRPALLAESVERVDANLVWLLKGLSQADFGEWLAALSTAWDTLKTALAAKPVAADGVASLRQIDALAEQLLQEAERLTASLQASGSVASLAVLNLAGRQRMLSQRFAKLALMELAGLPRGAQHSDDPMAMVQADFEQALARLTSMPLVTPAIQQTLGEANQTWQELLAAASDGPRTTGAHQVARVDAVAHTSETLLDVFERLSTHYERSMQMLMG